MTGSTTAEHDPAELGELERAVLELIWANGVQSADQVRAALLAQRRPLKESTVRTVLKRLEDKGYLQHSVDNRTFLYRPLATRQAVAGRAAQRIVDWFCQGSVETLLAGMVDSALLDRKELQRLAERIAAAKKGKQT
jgi:BlaI family transcriptional regulator, penicillinase repressor